MSVTDPRLLNEHYNELFRRGDLEGLVALYEPDAVLCPAPGRQVEGQAQIREQLVALLKLRGELSAEQKSCVEQGDLALLVASWKFIGSDEAGNPLEIGGHSSKIARKGADGAWRYAIDLPVAVVR